MYLFNCAVSAVHYTCMYNVHYTCMCEGVNYEVFVNYEVYLTEVSPRSEPAQSDR